MTLARLEVLIAVSTALILTAVPQAAAIAHPKRISFQGKLLDPATNLPKNGVESMTFKLYDAATGGSPLYTETQDVSVVNGVFALHIGAGGDLTTDLFSRTTSYIGVTVGGDTEMTPRQQLVNSAYSFVAGGLMRSKSIVINPGVAYSTFTAGGDLLVENGIVAGTGTFTSYVDVSGSAAPPASAAGELRLYYDSASDGLMVSENTRAYSTIGTGSLTLWNTNATAGVANQGLNLPAALTELNSAIRGTRMSLDCDELPARLAIRYNIRGITAAALTLVLSARDTSNTANVLATVSQSVSAANTTYAAQGSFAAKPGWCTGTQEVAVYTSGGNGAADFIFPHIVLLGKP